MKWNCLTLEPEFESKLLGENIQNYFHIFLNQKGLKIGKVDAHDALIFAAKKNCYNPVWEWLEGIENDSKIYQANNNTIAPDFLGTNDPLYDKMLKAFLIGAVSRAAERGCKFDNMLVLKGPKGFIKVLFLKLYFLIKIGFVIPGNPTEKIFLCIYKHALSMSLQR